MAARKAAHQGPLSPSKHRGKMDAAEWALFKKEYQSMRSQVVANNAKDLKAYAQKIFDSGERLSFKKHMEGFSEAQKIELRKHLGALRTNKKYHETYKHDPIIAEKKRKASNKWRKDPAKAEILKKQRKKNAEQIKEKYHTDPVFRAKVMERIKTVSKHKYNTDAEYKAKTLERSRKTNKKRYDTDPQYRERKKKAAREYARKQKLKKAEEAKKPE